MRLRNLITSAIAALAVFTKFAVAAEPSLPAGFKARIVTMQDGATLYVRSGGAGPAVVLIHGFGDTGDMWSPLAQNLSRSHTVIVPDLRGMGPK